MPGHSYEKIYETALDQHGCITTGQATALGIERHSLLMMERRGQLERLSHGVYRVTAIPLTSLTAYAAAILWPRTSTAVLSHETALDLYGVSDINPGRVHITIPRSHSRIRRTTPRAYNVHIADLPPRDIATYEGLPITTLERTIRDCAATHVGPYLLAQAIKQGRSTGRLSPEAARTLAADILAEDLEPEASHTWELATDGPRRLLARE